MNEQELPVVDDEWPALQPAQELVAIGCLEDRRDGVVPVRLRVPGRDGQQVEIVVAEDGDGGIAQRLHFAQHRERLGAAVDEIADEPETVALRCEADEREQLAELRVAALDVADRVVAHGRRATRVRWPKHDGWRARGC